MIAIGKSGTQQLWLHQSKTDEQLSQQVTSLRHEVHLLHEMLSAQHRVSSHARD